MKRDLAERFYPRLAEAENGCIEWQGCRTTLGYGRIGIGRKIEGTHRVAWMLAKGPIPPGMHLCHKCDNPPCCNVEHLFLGFAVDNMRDCHRKGRANTAHGERSGMCKLTSAQVEEIRRRYVKGMRKTKATGRSAFELAAEFGITVAYVAELANNTWRRRG